MVDNRIIEDVRTTTSRVLDETEQDIFSFPRHEAFQEDTGCPSMTSMNLKAGELGKHWIKS